MTLTLPQDLSLLALLGIITYISILSIWKSLGSLCRQYLVKRLITTDGLPLLGVERDKKIRGTAVVCGGRCESLVGPLPTVSDPL